MKLKFRSKMLLWIIGALVIIAGGVQYYLNYDISNIVLSTEKRIIESITNSIRDQLQSELNMDKLIVRILAHNKEIIAALESNEQGGFDSIQQYLSEFIGFNGKY